MKTPTFVPAIAIGAIVFTFVAGNGDVADPEPDPLTKIQNALEELKPAVNECPIIARIVSDFGLLGGHNPTFHPVFDPQFSEVQYDTAGAISVVNGEHIFTVPEDGLYKLTWNTVLWGDLNNPARTGAYQYQRFFLHNGAIRRDLWSYSFPRDRATSAVTVHSSDTVFLTAGDEIKFEVIADVSEPDTSRTIEKMDRIEILKVGNLP